MVVWSLFKLVFRSNFANPCLNVGGNYENGSNAGFWCFNSNNASNSNANIGGRQTSNMLTTYTSIYPVALAKNNTRCKALTSNLNVENR